MIARARSSSLALGGLVVGAVLALSEPVGAQCRQPEGGLPLSPVPGAVISPTSELRFRWRVTGDDGAFRYQLWAADDDSERLDMVSVDGSNVVVTPSEPLREGASYYLMREEPAGCEEDCWEELGEYDVGEPPLPPVPQPVIRSLWLQVLDDEVCYAADALYEDDALRRPWLHIETGEPANLHDLRLEIDLVYRDASGVERRIESRPSVARRDRGPGIQVALDPLPPGTPVEVTLRYVDVSGRAGPETQTVFFARPWFGCSASPSGPGSPEGITPFAALGLGLLPLAVRRCQRRRRL